MPKVKRVNYELIRPDDGPDEQAMYDLLLDLVGNHFRHLDEARFALAWRKALKPDPDGKLVLGKCRKCSDLDRELAEYDFVIILNREAWLEDFDPQQREALLYHELCHAGVTRGKDGEIKRDEKGRIVFRLRKHDIEEFSAVVERYGLYKADLAHFAEKCKKTRELPLFVGNGEEEAKKPARTRKVANG